MYVAFSFSFLLVFYQSGCDSMFGGINVVCWIIDNMHTCSFLFIVRAPHSKNIWRTVETLLELTAKI